MRVQCRLCFQSPTQSHLHRVCHQVRNNLQMAPASSQYMEHSGGFRSLTEELYGDSSLVSTLIWLQRLQ